MCCPILFFKPLLIYFIVFFLATFYLRQGYVFIGVSLFVSRFTQKLLNRFSQHLVEDGTWARK